MKSQLQMWQDAEAASARLNAAFMEMLKHPTNPLTAADLRGLIARRPDHYGRFAGFLPQLDAKGV